MNSKADPHHDDSLSEPQLRRRLLLRHSILTIAIFVPLVGAFATSTEWYPVPHYKMFYGASGLNTGHEYNYFVFRGETAAGETVDIPPITIMNGLEDRTALMVQATITNESLQLRWPHPENARLIAAAGSVDNLPPAALLPDLLRTWGHRYNARLAGDSPNRLVRVRLDEYKWPKKEYGNYFEFIKSWHVDL